MADSLEVLARAGHSLERLRSRTFEFAQSKSTRGMFRVCATEIHFAHRQIIFWSDVTCRSNVRSFQNEKYSKIWSQQTGIAELLRFIRVTVAFNVGIDAILVDSALTNVTGGVGSGPKVLSFAVAIVPPRVFHSVEFQWSTEAIVLESMKSMNTAMSMSHLSNEQHTNLNELATIRWLLNKRSDLLHGGVVGDGLRVAASIFTVTHVRAVLVVVRNQSCAYP